MLSNFTNLYFPICSFTISFFLFILFFNKKYIKNYETITYSKLVIIELLESLLYTFICLIAHFLFNNDNILLFQILNKILYCIYIIWFSYFLDYIIHIYFFNKEKNKISYISKYLIICFDLILLTLIFILPINIYYDPITGLSNSDGMAANILYFGVAIYLTIMILFAIMDFKKNKNKKYLPLYSISILMIIAMIIRKVDPLFSIYSNVLSFTLLIMYFTIENPDTKLLEEYIKNKEIAEKSLQDKMNLLFRVSQDIKKQVDIINTKSKNLIDTKKSDNEIKSIYESSTEINNIINGIFNINDLDYKEIKNFSNNYNIYAIFKQIILYINQNNNTVHFNYYIDSGIPIILYGDGIRLKQILFSIFNAMKNVKEGYINLDVTSLSIYNTCRMIITIYVSKMFLNINEINEIMIYDNDKGIKENDYENLNLSFKEIKKLINLLNGYFFIKSEEDTGTTFTIILDQLFKDKKEKIPSNLILTNKKKIIIIDDIFDELQFISKQFSKYNINVNSALNINEGINRINKESDFDLILINDNYLKLNIIDFKRKINDKNAKIIIMLDKNKELVKRRYTNDFKLTDYVLKSDLKNEIKRIVTNYLE